MMRRDCDTRSRLPQQALRRMGVFLTLCSSLPALATLGAPLSASAPPSAISGTPLQTTPQRVIAQATAPNGPYQRRDTTLPTGTVLQEFSRVDGVVFAVAWSGPVLPDLVDTLGIYFPAFARKAAARREAGQHGGTLSVDDPDFVMRSRGRMRAFSGFAYVPGLVPAGVAIDALFR